MLTPAVSHSSHKPGDDYDEARFVHHLSGLYSPHSLSPAIHISPMSRWTPQRRLTGDSFTMTSEARRFPDWMYGGPYLPVADPDRDLPRRDPRKPLTQGQVLATEQEGVFSGERFVAPFRDANALDEILGCLEVAQAYPSGWDDDERFVYPTIQGMLTEAILRIEAKIARTSTATKRNWFGEALLRVRRAAALYADAQYAIGEDLLAEAVQLLESGNKAHRRKVDQCLGPGDGSSTP